MGNQTNEQGGKNDNLNSTEQEGINNPKTSENSPNESGEKTNDSITRKEHDDTNHDHEYITPGDNQKSEELKQDSSKSNSTTEDKNSKSSTEPNEVGYNQKNSK